jgi:hypothetical protein
MNKRLFSFLLVVIFVVLIFSISYSAPDPIDPAIPIDGGVGFLLAAGLIYGVHKFKKSRKS